MTTSKQCFDSFLMSINALVFFLSIRLEIYLSGTKTVPGASTDIPRRCKLVKFQCWADLIYLWSKLLCLGEWKVQGPPPNPSLPLSPSSPERIGPERAFIVLPLSISSRWTINQHALCQGFLSPPPFPFNRAAFLIVWQPNKNKLKVQ